jgi:hypothetical protein
LTNLNYRLKINLLISFWWHWAQNYKLIFLNQAYFNSFLLFYDNKCNWNPNFIITESLIYCYYYKTHIRIAVQSHFIFYFQVFILKLIFHPLMLLPLSDHFYMFALKIFHSYFEYYILSFWLLLIYSGSFILFISNYARFVFYCFSDQFFNNDFWLDLNIYSKKCFNFYHWEVSKI